MADRIFEELSKDNIDVFYDKHDIKLGESIFEKITDEISKADFVLILISKFSENNQTLSTETSLAISKGKNIIPIVLEKGVDIPFFLKNINCLDLSEKADFENKITLLKSALKQENQATSFQHKYKLEKDYVASQKQMMEIEVLQWEKALQEKNMRMVMLSTTLGIIAITVSLLFTYLIFTKAENPKWASGLVGFILGYFVAMLIAYLHYKKKFLTINSKMNAANANKHGEGKNE